MAEAPFHSLPIARCGRELVWHLKANGGSNKCGAIPTETPITAAAGAPKRVIVWRFESHGATRRCSCRQCPGALTLFKTLEGSVRRLASNSIRVAAANGREPCCLNPSAGTSKERHNGISDPERQSARWLCSPLRCRLTSRHQPLQSTVHRAISKTNGGDRLAPRRRRQAR